MSDLRKQLESAKSEYRSLQYPGDLAADISHRHRSMIHRLAPFAALAAAAIVMIILGFSMSRVDHRQLVKLTTGSQSTIKVEPTTNPVSSETLLDSLDDLSGMSVVPPGYSFDISLPSFSLTADEQNNKTSTTQEST
jgi:hypothetical protein